jgi:hypothetical protein
VKTQKREPGDDFLLASHLLLLRLWREELGDGRSEWRAWVRHVLSGETVFIRRWQDLEAFLGTFDNLADLFQEKGRP